MTGQKEFKEKKTVQKIDLFIFHAFSGGPQSLTRPRTLNLRATFVRNFGRRFNAAERSKAIGRFASRATLLMSALILTKTAAERGRRRAQTPRAQTCNGHRRTRRLVRVGATRWRHSLASASPTRRAQSATRVSKSRFDQATTTLVAAIVSSASKPTMAATTSN